MKNTTLCYIKRGDSYLMLHRTKKQNDINQGKWIGVGGKLEENESPEEGVLREIKEETGITVTDYTYRAIVTFAPDNCEGEYMHLFTANTNQAEFTDCSEGILKWVKIKDLYSLPMWQGDKIFLKLIEKPCPFFTLKLNYRKDKLVSAILDGKVIKE